MRKLFTSIFLISIPLLTIGQVETEVSIIDLVRETQHWNKVGNKMSLSWWVPNEYWRIALKDQKQIPEETIEQIETVFVDYVMIWACDLNINLDGTMTYTGEDELGKSMVVIDKNGKKYLPLQKSQINTMALSIAENMKPFFAQALGQMGQGIHFYFFKVVDANQKNLINSTLPGEFKVLHSNGEFLWKLPLTTLMPPKFCPVDKEKMKGNWSYCPIHGQKLAN